MSSQKRHVLFLIPSLRGGGAERVIVTLLRYFDRSRFRLSLAVVDMKGAVFDKDVPADVELIDLKAIRVRHALPRIVALIWKLRPNLVFSTLGHLNLALAVFRVLLPNDIRYVAREGTVVSRSTGVYKMPRWWFLLLRLFYARFDAIVCQSLEMRDDLVTHFRVPPEKTIVIYNPVDIERVRELSREAPAVQESPRARGEISLVAAGRLAYVKGFDLLLDALALCGERPFSLTVLGDGPLLDDLRSRAALNALSDRVRFVGFQRNPYAFFSKADAFVLSSRIEGFPNVVLEALVCGTPVIAVPSPGGVREILGHAEGCILADECSAQALSNALMAFEPGHRISANACDRYAVERVAACYEEQVLVL